MNFNAVHQTNSAGNLNNNVKSSANSTSGGAANVFKNDLTNALLQAPLVLSAAAAANSSNTPHDLQAAAMAYLTAAYKAAAAQGDSSALATFANSLNLAEELIIQQQLQQNDQIEVTRIPQPSPMSMQATHAQSASIAAASATSSNNANSNLAQLLESPSAPPQNSSLLNVFNNNHGSALNNGNSHNSGNGNANGSNKSKQQKCPYCTYICDSKSQMNYHISLHKPTQYECSMCTFVCAKKQHLSSHMRTVHQQINSVINNSGSINTSAISATGSNVDFSMALQMSAAQAPKVSDRFIITFIANHRN